VLGQDIDPGDVVLVGDVEEAAVHGHRGAAAAGVDEHRPDGQGGQQRRVPGEHAEVAVDPAGADEVGLARPHLPLGGDQVHLQAGHGYSSPPSCLAFSSASSIPPTLKNACSGRWS
jgi:hypothetical protein